MTEPLFESASEEASEGAGNRRTLLVGGGVGVLALAAIGGYLLLSGGSSTTAALPVPHHVAAVAVASASASASPSAQSVLQTFHGDVDSRDPFAVPAALTAAAAPAAAAAAAPAAGAAAATPAAAASAGTTTTTIGTTGTTTLPTTVTSGGTTVTVLPSAAASPTSVASVPQGDEFLQLLASHHSTSGWTVDVQSASGVVKGVTPGTQNVAGTLFYFGGEDETSGSPTFVFELGESQGGNLVPNSHESISSVHADKSTLVLHDGNVDGGIYAE